jgi:copper(I)-binding protein
VTRWNRRLLFGAVALLIPMLAGCEAGANAPTLAFHPASSGVSIIKDGITIDNAFVLGSELGSTLPAGGQAGFFAAITATNGDRLESITAPGSASSVTVTGGTVNLPAQALVDLSGPEPQIVLTGLTNPLAGGESIQLVLNFAEAGPITLGVPVEPRAYDYASYSPPAIPAPEVSVKPVASGSVSPGASASAAGGQPSSSPSASASPSTTP